MTTVIAFPTDKVLIEDARITALGLPHLEFVAMAYNAGTSLFEPVAELEPPYDDIESWWFWYQAVNIKHWLVFRVSDGVLLNAPYWVGKPQV